MLPLAGGVHRQVERTSFASVLDRGPFAPEAEQNPFIGEAHAKQCHTERIPDRSRPRFRARFGEPAVVTDARDFPIIGIGASAGGIEALEGFFRGLPREPALALVIVTNLSPDRESLLHEIIARFTELPIAIAADGMQVEN
ncbi:MAG TPA: chemotaxis protein CheB, partial [Stellaceae bacterium]|nr:chemotaxis protein CheB [Stellaceae bacterium]